MAEISEKVILVTGASSRIGRACAMALAQQGHHVYGTSRAPRSQMAISPCSQWT